MISAVERWLAGLRNRIVPETEVPDELFTRVRLWSELTPHIPANQPGAWLVWKEEGRIRTERLDREHTFGRGTDADIVVNSRWLSRKHFVIRPADHNFAIEDLGSKNPLQVNRTRTTCRVLNSGDVLTIADQHFLFVRV